MTARPRGTDRTVRAWDLIGDLGQSRWIADTEVLAVAFNTAVTVIGDSAGQVHALRLNVPAAASFEDVIPPAVKSHGQ